MKKFEERLTRLEDLAERIKEPELGIEEAFAVFEEGIKLAKGLEKDLEKIEGKVELLINQPVAATDKPELTLFDQPGEF
ncbi:MAG: exodeoxyribonuclease VII small subunit [Spirochaetes bacterium]|nr:exodeoxyribonuclease VII small subunit [Spirochaetota bacterium]